MIPKDWHLLEDDSSQLRMLESPRELIRYPDDWLYHLDHYVNILRGEFWALVFLCVYILMVTGLEHSAKFKVH